MRYKFAIIGSAKGGDRTLMGRSKPNFTPKLKPIPVYTEDYILLKNHKN